MAACVILLSIPYYLDLVLGVTIYYYNSPEFYFLYSLLWTLILISCRYGTGMIRKILEVKFVRFLGLISFSLYLFHYPILLLTVNSSMPENLKIYAFFGGSIGVSYLSYLLIEKKLMKIRIHAVNYSLVRLLKRPFF